MSMTIRELLDEIARWGRDEGQNKPDLCETPAGEPVGSLIWPDIYVQPNPKGVDVNAVLAQLALMHSEVTEAVEAVRKGHYGMHFECDAHGRAKPEGMASELADVMILCIHLAGRLGIDLEEALYQKMAYNQSRTPPWQQARPKGKQ